MAPPQQKDLPALIALTKTTQTLLTHFQTSLATPPTPTPTPPPSLPHPLEALKASSTLLKSYTTTISLLLLTPPLTPSALITKIGDVSAGALSGMVAAATYVPVEAEADALGATMRGEVRGLVRRLLGAWGDVLGVVLEMAEGRSEGGGGGGKKADAGPSEEERKEVLAVTGVLWEACDALLKVCSGGVVGLVVRRAGELRAVLVDAIEEMKEWGEEQEDDDDEAEGSAGEFDDDDDFFGAQNKLGKDDKELKALLDRSIKKLKMVGMLYQALAKRRLQTFPAETTATDGNGDAPKRPTKKLDDLMDILKALPETVDDLASAFYDLDEDEAKSTLNKCCDEAKSAVALVRQSWTGADDEFTTWSDKWVNAFDTV